jgi:M6 family metalloprotease-like protein
MRNASSLVPAVSYRKLATNSLLVVIILSAIVPHSLPLLTLNLQYSLAPSIDGSDIIHYSPGNTITPVTGVARVIVIAVDFGDRTFNLTISDLNVIFFHRLSNYISNISYGKLRIEGLVAGVFRAPKLMSTYGADDGLIDGDPVTGVRSYQLVEDAVEVADSKVDFTSYQYLVIVHAGVAQEANPEIAQNIWSVAYVGGITFKTNEKSYDRAAIVAESEGRGADVLGPIAHEFLHLLGLPDLYDKYDAHSGDAGKWDVMGRGSWNGDPPGSAPAQPTAWSKAALGWIEPEQIGEVSSGQNYTAYIDPVEKCSSNLKAVKIPLSESTYYMVEYRSRALDRGLPDEGVLITLIDLNKIESGGAMTIISTHGKTSNAPLKLGEFYANKANDLLISTRFYNATTYGIDIIRGQYRTIEIKLPSSNVTPLVDGKPCTPHGSGATVIFVTPSSHTIAVPNTIIINPGSRALFNQWSDGVTESERTLRTTANVSMSALYKQQVILSIASNGISDASHPSKLEINGMAFSLDDLTSVNTWMDVNQTANIAVLTHTVSVDDSTRYVFKGWSGDNSNSTLIGLQMSQPLKLVAQFQKQFYLQVRSEFGNPSGEGWYDNGTKAILGVSSPHYISTTERYSFDYWNGIESKQSAASVIMDGPRTITAQWKRQLLVSIALIGSNGQPLQAEQLKIQLEAPNGTEIAQPLTSDVWLDEGLWLVRTATWMNVDVSPLERAFRPTGGATWTIHPNLHTLMVSVASSLLRRGISDITVYLELPDKELYVGHTNQTGQITISNLPQYDYHVTLMRGGEEVSSAHLHVVQDTRLDVRISDPLENTVVAGFAILGTLSLASVTMPSAVSRLRRKRSKLNPTALDERVYEYILSHAGVISKSEAARDLGTTREALVSAINRLSKTRIRDKHKQQHTIAPHERN